MRNRLAAISAALMLVVFTSSADARRHSAKPTLSALEIVKLKRELADTRNDIRSVLDLLRTRPPAVAGAFASAPVPFIEIKPPIVLASLSPADMKVEPQGNDRATRVFPATCTQRGQFRDRRRTHLHAGIDCAGERGSPIVASIGGRVLRAPGGDRGYGPIVRVILGDDGVVYRYTHMGTVLVKPGDRVETGQQLGTMGVAGRLPHLHFETIPHSVYRRHAYGAHGIDPNVLLGQRRGARMLAGDAMPAIEGIMLASTDPVADRTRIKKRHARRDHARRHGHRLARV